MTAELGEIVLGPQPGHTDGRTVTLFESVGIAAQDAVAARLLWPTLVGSNWEPR